MADIVEGAKDILVAAGVGIEGIPPGAGFGIFAGKAPDEPDTAISIVEAGGAPSNPKWLLDFPSIQVRVRGAKENYSSAQVQAQAVKDALLGLPSQDILGDRWVSVTMIGDKVPLGQDGKGRWEWTINFSLIIEPAIGTNRIPL